MKRCIIFSAGSYYGLPLELNSEDYIIAADAGYLNCLKAGVKPQLLLGDFDSMELPDESNLVETKLLRAPVEKDDTDTMLAIKDGLTAGCSEFHILGGTGGKRLDHTIANLQALIYLAEHGARGYMYDSNAIYTAIHNDCISIEKKVDWGLISIFCLGEAAYGVSLQGMQYPLENGELRAGFPLGVSNHFSSDEAIVKVDNGSLLICWETEAVQ